METGQPQEIVATMSIRGSLHRRPPEAEERPAESGGNQRRPAMRKLIVSEFISLDGVIQAPGGPDEDRDGGFAHGGWTLPYWHDDIGKSFAALMQHADALLLGRKTYVTHAQVFEPMPKGDFFGDMMNAPAKYVVSRTLEKPIWRQSTIIRDDVVGAVKALKIGPGKDILTDGSSQLVHTLMEADLVDELHLLVYPLVLGGGKRLFPERLHTPFKLKETTSYPSGVVGLDYVRER
jgi:dihydrofolate reductase